MTQKSPRIFQPHFADIITETHSHGPVKPDAQIVRRIAEYPRDLPQGKRLPELHANILHCTKNLFISAGRFAFLRRPLFQRISKQPSHKMFRQFSAGIFPFKMTDGAGQFHELELFADHVPEEIDGVSYILAVREAPRESHE